jgi:hypothetical protein
MQAEEKGHLKNFQGPYQESKQEPSILWHSASTTYTPPIPLD